MRHLKSYKSVLIGCLLLSCGRKTVTRVETVGLGPASLAPSVGIHTSAASPSDCPNGGQRLIVFLDENIDALFQVEENILSESNICNGSNGSNGQNGSNAEFIMGSVGPDVPGKAYSACHHDYLYIPDSNNGSRGWLTFRHQANGSADQGIGSTGFQIWNVDIANFSLGSEVGSVIYCNLQWDSVLKILNYTVVDNSDGMAGIQGSLQF